MQKIFRKIFSFWLAAAFLFAAPAIVGRVSAEEDYYASVTAARGDELLGQVHDLITRTHKKYTSYSDCKNPEYARRTDPGPNGELMEFYAQTELSSTWQSGASGTWNREHVWCQSLSNGLWGESGGGSDLLHIRPTESRVNSARGNNKYGEIKNGSVVWYRNRNNEQVAIAGYVGGSKFEPIDSVKGDVARIVMYMYTHYNTYQNVYGTTNGQGAGRYFGTLRFSNVVSAGNEDEAVELLLSWHELDPVDELELARNEAAFEIQGNRNPFVDHPEYAELIWGDEPYIEELQSLSLDPSSMELLVGESRALTVVPTPAEANAEVEWSVSDPSVVSLSNGTVTAVGEGTATVTATSKENPEVKAAATVTVKSPIVDPDPQKLETFRKAVSSLAEGNTLAERYALLGRAISVYLTLSEAERAEAAEETATLRECVQAYNLEVREYNERMRRSGSDALGSAGGLLR